MRVTMRDKNLMRRGLLPVLEGQALFRNCDFSTWKLTVNGNDSRWDRFRPGWGISIWDDSGKQMLSGPATEINESVDDVSKKRTIEVTGVSDSIHLADSLVIPNPPAGATAAADLWKASGAGETVMRKLVNEQIGPSAPVDYRIPFLRLRTDELRGKTVSVSERFTNLLTVMQAQAQAAGLQFSIVQEGLTLVLVFRVQKDLSRAVRLSRANGAVGGYKLSEAAPKATESIVGGVGSGSSRKMWRVARPLGDWNRRITTFTDRQSTSDTNELQQAAESELTDKAAEKAVTFEVRDTNRLKLGRDFNVGDKITIDLDGAQVTDTLQIAELKWDSKGRSANLQVGPTADESKLNEATGSVLEMYKKIWSDIRRSQTR